MGPRRNVENPEISEVGGSICFAIELYLEKLVKKYLEQVE